MAASASFRPAEKRRKAITTPSTSRRKHQCPLYETVRLLQAHRGNSCHLRCDLTVLRQIGLRFEANTDDTILCPWCRSVYPQPNSKKRWRHKFNTQRLAGPKWVSSSFILFPSKPDLAQIQIPAKQHNLLQSNEPLQGSSSSWGKVNQQTLAPLIPHQLLCRIPALSMANIRAAIKSSKTMSRTTKLVVSRDIISQTRRPLLLKKVLRRAAKTRVARKGILVQCKIRRQHYKRTTNCLLRVCRCSLNFQ